MSEVTQEGAPAVASVDPANLSGPGVTQNPPNAEAVFDVASIAQENARLRADLIAENERLKSALADSRASGLAAQGLSDEDVRRLEHPEEYLDEYAALGEHEALKSQFASLSERLAAAEQVIANANTERAQFAQSQATGAPRESVAVTEAPLEDHSQTFRADDPATLDGPSAQFTNEPSRAAAAAGSTDLSSLSDSELSAELARREAGEPA